MRCIFYATFIPGLRECIAEIIQERLADVAILRLLDGAVLFETECGYDKLNFFCFNNIFASISIMEHHEGSPLETHLKALVAKGTPPARMERIIAQNSKKIRSFRLVFSEENKPAAINEKLRTAAERYIADISGLGINRSRPDTEFWFLYRREGGLPAADFSIFMKRLTLRPSWEKSLHPGELPPPLAWMLCRFGRLKHTDTVLDPFCGYGSIPHAAIKYFHITKFIAADNSKKAAAYTAALFKAPVSSSLVLHTADFRSLVSLIPAKSVDAIITDPPWGLYQELPERDFYAEMFRVFGVLLKKGGRIVMLCARDNEILRAAGNRFKLEKHIPVLLSGKKAAVFQFYLE